MRTTLRNIAIAIATALSVAATAAPIDEARRLYDEGAYTEALDVLEGIVRRTPRDGTANYYLGATLMALGRSDEAAAPLEKARARGVTDAYGLLATIALDNYDPSTAVEHIDGWRERLRRNRKPEPDALEELSSRAVRMRNMLERVEAIEVIDSIAVDRSRFFEVYRLSAESGRILPPAAVGRALGRDTEAASVAFMPQSRTEMLWAEADSAGTLTLYGAGILDDGSPDHPAPLAGLDGTGESCDYPFLMADGQTLYFASCGEGSLGGYDIFMTRRDDDGSYMQPQNIGMPYNSPADDYMLAIDEISGLGWWATDRNNLGDSLTVYVFIPSAVRVNVDPDSPDIASLARLADIGLTLREGTDPRAELDRRLALVHDDADDAPCSGTLFTLDLGDGRVLTSLSDFSNSAARSAMTEYLGTEGRLRSHLAAEEALRDRYRRGDRSVAAAISDSEAETSRLRAAALAQRNNAIRLERGH